MKKSLLALAVLGAFAGVASAQSSVTMYGRVDLSFAKNMGSDAKGIQNGSNSRLGFKGVEDLGGGLSTIFNLEMRFNADTGAVQDPNRFFKGLSIVGLQSADYGQFVLGRNYTTSYNLVQCSADPWCNDTVVGGIGVASLTNVPLGAKVQLGTTGLTQLGIATVRNDNSATYTYSLAGFTVAGQIAEANALPLDSTPYKPVNVAASYVAGPISAGGSYERTGRARADGKKEEIGNISFAYDLDVVKLGVTYAKGLAWSNNGTTAAVGGSGRKGYMLTATAPIGAGQLRFAFGEAKYNTSTFGGYGPATKPIGVGYFYSLSKRTTLYTDYEHDSASGLLGPRSAYDFGIKHNF
jgi:predicted porin